VSCHLLSDTVTSVRASRQVAPPSAFLLTRCDLHRADVALLLLYIYIYIYRERERERMGIGVLNEPIRDRGPFLVPVNNLGQPIHILLGSWACFHNEFRGWGMSTVTPRKEQIFLPNN
jgi:hypothetical protein